MWASNIFFTLLSWNISLRTQQSNSVLVCAIENIHSLPPLLIMFATYIKSRDGGWLQCPQVLIFLNNRGNDTEAREKMWLRERDNSTSTASGKTVEPRNNSPISIAQFQRRADHLCLLNCWHYIWHKNIRGYNSVTWIINFVKGIYYKPNFDCGHMTTRILVMVKYLNVN